MLRLTNVKKSYSQPDGTRLPILDIPKFSLGEGEQMVLIGESGSGKTTLLHTIAGITRCDTGEIAIDRTDVAKLSENGCDRFRASKIGYVFQTFNLLPAFTAWENIVLGMTFARGAKNTEWATKLLDRIGLTHRADHHPNKMSVGEQQRVAVARALVNRPRLVLADEPTANVDPANQQNIIDLIRQTCDEQNIALLMVTHSMQVAEQFPRIDRLEDINQVKVPPATAGMEPQSGDSAAANKEAI